MGQQYIYWEESKEKLTQYKDPDKLCIPIGKDKDDNWVIKDLVELGNILISGHTGTGKSNFLNLLICSLMVSHTKEDLRFVLIDTKLANLYTYENTPYLLETTANNDIDKLRACIKIIEDRKQEDTRHPHIVIVIDEFATLILNDQEIEKIISQIATDGPKLGVHIVLSSSNASQRVFTDRIKTIIPARLVGALAGEEDSIAVLDQDGAENLNGNGDMIFKHFTKTIRIQTPYISYEDQMEVLRERN
jgi:S-DNA-T family DNA segregation ATPase FtsK/SpoIIIE